MSAENQRDEEEKKAQAQLEADRFRAKKLLKDVPVSALKMNFLIEQLVCDYQIIRQSWERELEATKDYARQLADKGITLEKEKAGLEERVKIIEQDRDSWRRCAERLEKEKTEPKLTINIEESAIKELFKNQAEELTRLKSRNEELEAENHRLRLTQNIKQCNHYAEGFVPKSDIDRLKAENAELRKDWLIEPHEDTSEGFWGRSCARLQQKNDRLTASLARAMEIIRKILKQCYLTPVDHACIECVPAGSSVVKGFLCGFHEGVKALSDPSGSVAFEKWKKMEAVVEACKLVQDGTRDPHLVDGDYENLRLVLEALDAKG